MKSRCVSPPSIYTLIIIENKQNRWQKHLYWNGKRTNTLCKHQI